MEHKERLSVVSHSPDETKKFGEAFGRRLTSGVCVSLIGALGAGKTVAVAGICRGLEIDEAVLSPTFVLYEEFRGRLPVVHVDLYRLEHESEMEELGLFDLIGGESVILAEWGDRSEILFGRSEIVVKLEYLSSAERNIVVSYQPAAARLFEDVESWLP